MVYSTSKQVIARVVLPLLAKRKTYQPVMLGGRVLSAGGRETYKRWHAIEKVMEDCHVSSVLDIGCAEGFFIRKAVEKGCFATGVDADPAKILWANTTLSLDNLEGFSFIKLHITSDNLRLLPPSELTINLSLLHHVMYSQGENYALHFMQEVRKLTCKVMVFEMGQSNETHYSWSGLLPDMGPDPHLWIENFLRRCGFDKEIKKICTVASHKADIERAVFAAYV